MRDAAIDGLLAVYCAELHRRLAPLRAQTPRAARPEDLAHHYEAGGDTEHAARCWLEAGRVAAGPGASTEAIALFRRSLSALDDLPEGDERTTLELDVQLGLGTAASALEGDTSPNARADFERGAELGARLGATAPIFPALWGPSSYRFVLGEHRLDHG